MIQYIEGKMLRDMFVSGANNLQNHKELVDKLNVFPVPDGDTGTNMSLTISYAMKELAKVENDSITEIGKSLSKGSLMGARGNSGVILSQIIRGFSKSIEGKEQISTEDLAKAFKNGSDTAYKAVIKPIEGTILTVVRESGEYAIKAAKKEKDLLKFLEMVIDEANKSLERTPELLKNLKEAGVVDSGGKGLVLIYEGMYEALKGNPIKAKDLNDSNVSEVKQAGTSINTEDIKFCYCTEFILESNSISDTEIRDIMLKYGDSLAVVGDEGIIKVHVHTNDPGLAIQKALTYGSLTSMNPSTEDFMKAIDSINAKNIFIFPNNSNIIMAANQAKELSDKNIIVIPTKNTPQGFTALVNFNADASVEENEQALMESLTMVKSGQVTFAVRDTVMNDVEVKEGNIIGIAESKLMDAGDSVDEITTSLVEKLVDEDSAIITLFYGEDVTEEDANNLRDELEEKFEDLDIELYYGGQPLYYYLISVE